MVEITKEKNRDILFNSMVSLKLVLLPQETNLESGTLFPLYLQVKRFSYLFQENVMQEIKDHWELDGENQGKYWFEYFDENDKEFKLLAISHLPVGVIVDCLGDLGMINLRLRLFDFPYGKILDLSVYKSVRDVYINSLKQASYIMWKSTQNIMTVSDEELTHLWNSLTCPNSEDYDKALEKISKEEVENIPVRVISNGHEFPNNNRIFSLTENLVLRTFLEQIGSDSNELYIHGVKCQGDVLEAKLSDLYKMFHSPDLFLYIVGR